MNKRKPRRNRRDNSPLRVPLAEKIEPEALCLPAPLPAPPQSPRMPRPPRSTRAVLDLLGASTGLTLAGLPEAVVELLPGSPTTVLVVSGGEARAAFILPVSHAEASRALGYAVKAEVDRELDRLWEEQRHAN